MSSDVTPEQFLAGTDSGLAIYRWLQSVLADGGFDFTVSTSKSQVAFRRRRGFAYLWLPGKYLRRPNVDVVLSLALSRELPSGRFKEITRSAPAIWMHHLEVHSVADLDDEMAAWLSEAAEAAGLPTR
ncbi:MAG TPA: DUF5655 domain-containing protein [Jiangellaceae bacterium]